MTDVERIITGSGVFAWLHSDLGSQEVKLGGSLAWLLGCASLHNHGR